jgi:asparagine synthase (glutamine-hydrolysing)
MRGGALVDSGCFEPAALDRLVQQHVTGRRDHSATLWGLLMFDAFLRRTQKPEATVAPVEPTPEVRAVAGAQT